MSAEIRPGARPQESDEELLRRIREDAGAEEATDLLMDRYKDLVRVKAQGFYLLGADRQDLIQEGMIGLFKAIRDHDPGKDASFRSFAALCIQRQLIKAVEAAGRLKNQPLNTAVSLDSAGQGEEEETSARTLHESLPSNAPDPLKLLVDREDLMELHHRIRSQLSPYEQEVLGRYMAGRDYREIAQAMGKTPKSVDNALQRIKKKLAGSP